MAFQSELGIFYFICMRCRSWTIVFLVAALTTFSASGQALKTSKDKIQIAFLLDVSGSMDQLILKTKSQFWRFAQYLGTATKKGRKPIVEFSLIVYGCNHEETLHKILNDFTADLDSVAMNLHEIEIGGSTEYCWSTLNIALEQLAWSRGKDDLKIIIIAGNESFNQETSTPEMVIAKAKQMGVVINTIYCSPMEQDSIRFEWQSAAEQAKGSYFSISLNDSLNTKDNFLDNKLSDFNDKLNETYMPYGPAGQKSFARMILQDKNSKMAGVTFLRERILFKASDSFNNPNWDLVDAVKADSTLLTRLESLKNVTGHSDTIKLRESIENKQYMRESYKEVIRLRYEMIKKYLGENKGDKDLDIAVKKIAQKEGHKKNFEFRVDYDGPGHISLRLGTKQNQTNNF
jgi:hypothetical protein